MTPTRDLTIESAVDSHYSVVVDEGPRDVSVTIWCRLHECDRAITKRIGAWTLDWPFHETRTSFAA